MGQKRLVIERGHSKSLGYQDDRNVKKGHKNPLTKTESTDGIMIHCVPKIKQTQSRDSGWHKPLRQRVTTRTMGAPSASRNVCKQYIQYSIKGTGQQKNKENGKITVP